MQSTEDLPIFETEAERNMIWSRNQTTGEPVLAIRDATRGFLFVYDMGPTENSLDDETVQELRNVAKPQRLTIGPSSQIELIGGTIGSHSGQICCPSEDAARHLASHLSDKITNKENWSLDKG